MSLTVAQIRTDGGTQSRASINEATVAEYAEAMQDENTVFPPVIVYFDGKEYWLADGFHRLAAWQRVGREDIPADVRQGDRRRAILHSVAANSAHGLRRTNEDKRRAVLTLLEDAEWSQWSDSEIARRCAVSREYVNRQRSSVTCDPITSEARTYTTKHGTEAKMNTAKIGAVKKEPAASEGQRPAEAPVEVAVDAAPPEPTQEATPERKALAKLTREALEDDVIGLRADLSDAKSKAKLQADEIASLKAQLKDALDSDSGQVIRKLTASLKNAENAKWRATEEQGRLQKQIFALRKRVEELEGMGIAL